MTSLSSPFTPTTTTTKRPAPVRRQQHHPLALADSRLGLRMQAFLGKTNNGTRLALAGALAGGFSNLVLYPIDLAKTLKQAGPSSKGANLASQARIYGLGSLWAGLTPAILGSMPSSALYFGVYEYVKRRLTVLANASSAPLTSSSSSSSAGDELYEQRAQVLRRWLVHAVAAASGNTASSLVFVPKEVLKQQLQMYRNSHGGSSTTLPRVLASILKEKGIRGLYSGYRATLLRNIPSAILRFALYEEFKLFLGGGAGAAAAGAAGAAAWLRLSAPQAAIVAGALAGAISSAATTPLDVVKTRMAINACPPGRDVIGCLVDVAQREGVPGLYSGLGFRVLYSALFTAVGFSSFEASKALLGVGEGGRGGEEGKEGGRK